MVAHYILPSYHGREKHPRHIVGRARLRREGCVPSQHVGEHTVTSPFGDARHSVPIFLCCNLYILLTHSLLKVQLYVSW